MDPVISSKYGHRPLLDVPALTVGTAPRADLSTSQPSHLAMAPPPLYRLNQQHEQQIQGVPGDAGVPAPPAMPANWPYAVGMPGSLFATPPGPLPYKGLQPLPYKGLQPLPYPFLHLSPMTLQPPPYHMTDSSGHPVPPPLADHQVMPLSQLYPGVHDPCPPQSVYVTSACTLSQLVPQYPRGMASKPVTDSEKVHFEGVLTHGQLSTLHSPDKSSAFHTLPHFLRQELQRTYGHVPVTDVQIVSQNGEFHVYATPHPLPPSDTTDSELLPADQRMIH